MNIRDPATILALVGTLISVALSLAMFCIAYWTKKDAEKTFKRLIDSESK
jgi:hypothetical protein